MSAQAIHARNVGLRLQPGTVALLTAAEDARADLSEQPGGAAPTLRAVYYRIVALHALAKSERDIRRARHGDGECPALGRVVTLRTDR